MQDDTSWLDAALKDSQQIRRRRLAGQLDRAAQQRRLVGDHAAAALALAWAADARRGVA